MATIEVNDDSQLVSQVKSTDRIPYVQDDQAKVLEMSLLERHLASGLNVQSITLASASGNVPAAPTFGDIVEFTADIAAGLTMYEMDGATEVASASQGEGFVYDGAKWRRFKKMFLKQDLVFSNGFYFYETNLAASELAGLSRFKVQTLGINEAAVSVSRHIQPELLLSLPKISGTKRNINNDNLPTGSCVALTMTQGIEDPQIDYLAVAADDHTTFTAGRVLYAQADYDNLTTTVSIIGEYPYYIAR